MKRLAAIATVLMGMGFPAFAQHGGGHGGGSSGGHGGFQGHASAPARGGFGISAPSRGGAAPRMAGGPRNSMAPQMPRRSGPGMPGVYSRGGQMPVSRDLRSRNPNGGSGHDGRGRRDYYRRPYVSAYGYGFVPWVAPWTGWAGSDYLDYSGYDDSATDQGYQQGYQDNGYDSQPVQDERPALRPEYQPQGVESQSSQIVDRLPVTLIFKDGRAPEQIHNYILSRTTLFVMDQHHREIPVDQLDLASTEKLNRDAGVDFHLPDARN